MTKNGLKRYLKSEREREKDKTRHGHTHKGQTRSQNKENGTSLSEQAVLYRMNAQSNVIENYFARAGIPYRIYGGQNPA